MNQLVSEGMSLLHQDKKEQALECFKNALEYDRVQGLLRIKDHQVQYYRQKDYNLALLLGKMLIPHFRKDAAFLNLMGNCARRLTNLESARAYYEQANSVKASYRLSQINLAAMKAGVERYDREIEVMIAPLMSMREYKLPGYEGDHNFIGKTMDYLLKKKAGSPVGSKDMIQHIEERIGEIAQVDASLENLEPLLINLLVYATSVKNLIKAHTALQRLVELKSPYPYLEMIRAILFDIAGTSKQCESGLLKFARLNPEDRYAQVNLAICHTRAGRDNLALESWIKAGFLLEQSHGFYSFAEIQLEADHYYKQNNIQEAGRLYGLLLQSRKSPRVLIKMAQCMVRVDPEKAFGYLEEAPKLCEDKQEAEKYQAKAVEVLLHQAGVQEDNRHFEDAAILYEYALKLGTSIELLQKAIDCYRRIGKALEVARLEDHLVELQEVEGATNQELKRRGFIALGQKYLDLKKYPDAIHYLERAFDIRYDKEVFETLSSIYRKLNYRRALTELKKKKDWLLEREGQSHLDVEDSNYMFYRTYGLKNFKKKEYVVAQQYLEKAMEISYDQEVFMRLAWLYKKLNRTEDLQRLLGRRKALLGEADEPQERDQEESQKI